MVTPEESEENEKPDFFSSDNKMSFVSPEDKGTMVDSVISSAQTVQHRDKMSYQSNQTVGIEADDYSPGSHRFSDQYE